MLTSNLLQRILGRVLGSIPSMQRLLVTKRGSRTEVKVDEWIRRLTKPQRKMGGLSICPFAETAKYTVIESDISDVAPVDGVDVAIFVITNNVTFEELVDWRNALNRRYKDYIFLEDHKDDPTFISGIQTNFNEGNLMLCQERKGLLRARNTLSKTEYYEYWSTEMHRRIVKDGE